MEQFVAIIMMILQLLTANPDQMRPYEVSAPSFEVAIGNATSQTDQYLIDFGPYLSEIGINQGTYFVIRVDEQGEVDVDLCFNVGNTYYNYPVSEERLGRYLYNTFVLGNEPPAPQILDERHWGSNQWQVQFSVGGMPLGNLLR